MALLLKRFASDTSVHKKQDQASLHLKVTILLKCMHIHNIYMLLSFVLILYPSNNETGRSWTNIIVITSSRQRSTRLVSTKAIQRYVIYSMCKSRRLNFSPGLYPIFSWTKTGGGLDETNRQGIQTDSVHFISRGTNHIIKQHKNVIRQKPEPLPCRLVLAL